MERQLVNNNKKDRLTESALALNTTQVVIGVNMIILGTVQRTYNGSLAFLCTPIWCGLFFLATGTAGLTSQRRNMKFLTKISRVLSLISATILTPVLVCIVCFALATSVGYILNGECLDVFSVPPKDCDLTKRLAYTDVVVNSLLLLLGVVNIVISLLAYGCCIKRCCGQRNTNTTPTNQLSHSGVIGYHASTAPATDSSVFMVPWYGYQVTTSPLVQDQFVLSQPMAFPNMVLPMSYGPQRMDDEV
ncbi:uncharacterized protein [Ptychodera flava]|uniref:uncharacterized protein n=1 Tax=Ptychodera flava TaxID=63121 RepID=UPI00396A8A37